MKLVVVANLYEGMNEDYFMEWRKALGRQLDMDFELVYTELQFMNSTLARVTQEYDAVLMLDVDDIPEEALTHVAKINAKKHDVTAISMKLVDEDNVQFGLFGGKVDVEKYNVWGCGNTVWKSDVLDCLLPFDYSIERPDWAMAREAHREGFDLHVERLPLIRYRRYNDLQAGLVKKGDAYAWG